MGGRGEVLRTVGVYRELHPPLVKCCAIVGIVRREAGIAYSFTLNKSALSGNGVTTSGGYIQVVIERFLKDTGV